MYNQVLTNGGAALLRDAVNNSKKIVFTRAICGSHYDMDSRGDLAAKPIGWYNGATGSITTVKADASGLVVIASFSAVDSGTDPVKSACICAQIAKDGVDPEYDPDDDIIYAAWCDDNAQYVSGDDITIKFSLPVSIVGLVDDVTPPKPDPDYVTLDTVQTITGVKTFSEDGNAKATLAGDLVLSDQDGYPAAQFGSETITIYPNGLESESNDFEYAEMPLNCTYSTADKTVDLTLGNGTKIRLTCTNVEEVSE